MLEIDNSTADKENAKKIVIHQPNFLPRLKVLQKINAGDVWVVFDDVQFVTREWQNRCRIRYLKRPENEFWLTIPVSKPYGRNSLVNTIKIIEPARVKNQILKSIWHTYHASKYWSWIEKYSEAAFELVSDSLVELCVQSTLSCFSSLGIQKTTLLSSKLKTQGRKNAKLIEICKSVNANFYLCGSGGLSYLKVGDFSKNDIVVEIQNWSPPNKNQNQIELGWRNVSFIDFLARYGPDALKEHLFSWESKLS